MAFKIVDLALGGVGGCDVDMCSIGWDGGFIPFGTDP